MLSSRHRETKLRQWTWMKGSILARVGVSNPVFALDHCTCRLRSRHTKPYGKTYKVAEDILKPFQMTLKRFDYYLIILSLLAARWSSN